MVTMVVTGSHAWSHQLLAPLVGEENHGSFNTEKIQNIRQKTPIGKN
jgi:hypothetical protein